MAKIALITVGKTTQKYVEEAVNEYLKRLKFYVPFELIVIPELKDTKNIPVPLQKEKEGELILKKIEDNDDVILLDEKGREFTSTDFSAFVEKRLLAGKRIVFVIGGPFGFSPDIYARANAKISLSQMTFSHQIIRIIFAEQLYRAFTILKGENYHHE
ncbi:MAG: 23S rRNA (pseudouridine(1915)-N(3))-methyltransferase RlmH [Prevotellaceae bacterium]|jgi:23S rRNA (pseudouridine1915-N3)-methyltransferase|nr:23S rRNA (pseudouridine(1915)-N(3))-methyltransferase RlmH [Prevotellaceae bacterium]